MFPSKAKNGKRGAYLFEHFTVSHSDTAKVTFQGVSTADQTRTPFVNDDKVAFAGKVNHDLFITKGGTALDSGSVKYPVCGYMPVQLPTALVTSTGGKASATFNAASIKFDDDHAGLSSYKHIICLCRTAVTGACSVDKPSAFFNMAGYLHTVFVNKVDGLFARSTGKIIKDVSFSFTRSVTQSDRFAIVKDHASTDFGSVCGRFIQEHNDVLAKEVPYWDRYETLAFPPNENSNVEQTDCTLVSSTPSPNITAVEATFGQSIQVPNMKFYTKMTHSICYCGAHSENACPSMGLAAAPIGYNHYVHYLNYGAKLGTLTSSAFLTHSSTQTVTLFKGAAATDLTIFKTSPAQSLGGVDFEANEDKWALTLGTCGSVTTVHEKKGSLEAVGFAASTFTPCVTESSYQCHSGHAATKNFKIGGTHDMSSLASNKYNLCLCSRDGTATRTKLDGTMTCEIPTVNTQGLKDYSDQAGYVYVVDGAEQNLNVNVFDTGSVKVTFGLTQVVTANDKLAIVEVGKLCGDAGLHAQNTVLDSATYEVVNTGTSKTLSASAVQFKEGGEYKLCYCSATLEGSCTKKDDYGIELGTLNVNDFSFSETSTQTTMATSKTVTKNGKLNVRVSFGASPAGTVANKIIGATRRLALTNQAACPNPFTAQLGKTTPYENLTTSGNQVEFDTSQFPASQVPLTLCVYDVGSLKRHVDSMHVYVSDVRVSPRVTPRTTSVKVKFEYEKSLTFSTQKAFFLQSQKPCSDAYLPTSSMSDQFKTGLQNVPASGSSVTFDFSQTQGSEFRLCIGQGCSSSSCSSYLDYDNLQSKITVYESLTVSPTVVDSANNIPITIKSVGALEAGTSVWFSSAASCGTKITVSTATQTAFQAITSPAVALNFDFSHAGTAHSNDVVWYLCSEKGGDVVSFDPIGVRVAEVTAEPSNIRPGVKVIKLTRVENSLKPTDYMYFTTGDCQVEGPSIASSTSTATVQYLSTTEYYKFDFGKIATGVAKLCVIPTTHTEKVVYTFSNTKISIVDIQILPQAVKYGTSNKVSLTYGAGTLSPQHRFFFARDTDTDCVTEYFGGAPVQVPKSGESVTIDFTHTPAVGQPAHSGTQKGYHLCSINATGTKTSHPAVQIYVTSVAIISGTSVSKAATQGFSFSFLTPEIANTNRLQFVQSSSSCIAPSKNSSSSAATVSGLKVGDTSFASAFDFSEATVSAEGYRLCVTSATGDLLLDLTNVLTYVSDLSMRPKKSDGFKTTFRFLSEDGTGEASLSSLMPGDEVWLESTSVTDNQCTPKTVADGTTTSKQTIDIAKKDYTFSFEAANAYGEWRLCTSRGGVVRTYGNVKVYVADVAVPTANRRISKGNPALIPFMWKGTSLVNNDVLFFLRSSEVSCKAAAGLAGASPDSTEVRSSKLTLAANPADIEAVPTAAGFFQKKAPLTFAFAPTAPSDLPFRMCVERATGTIDLSFVRVTLQDISIEQSIVYARNDETVNINVKAGLSIGNVVFFAENEACAPLTNKLNVTSITNGIASLSFDFDKVGPAVLCVGSSAASTEFSTTTKTVTVVAKSMKPISTTNGDILGVVRQQNYPGVLLEEALRGPAAAGPPPYRAVFKQGSELCGDILDAVNPASGAPPSIAVDFSKFSMSKSLYRLCVRKNGANSNQITEYKTIGVMVSDLTIMGSSVGCVSSAASQEITFSINAALVFDRDSKLFFKQVTTADAACGGAPLKPSLQSSAAVDMGVVDPTNVDVNGRVTWTQSFDFKGADGSTGVYRLCVESASGLSTDYSPLGVRVSDIVITNSGANSGDNSFAPIGAQSMTVVTSKSIDHTTETLFFVDMSSPLVTCECAHNNVCASSAKKSANFVSASSSIDLTGLAGSSSATACVRTATGVFRTLNCVGIKFGATVYPTSVPGNDKQELSLTFSGTTLKKDDRVVWISKGSACSAPAFVSDAHKLNPYSFSSTSTIVASGAALKFNFTQQQSSNVMTLCVQRGGGYFSLADTTVAVTQAVTVGIGGDPHVRAADGKWLDFYGEAGVYNLLDSVNVQANAKFGYAVRDNHMIWHPKVMRPGTLMEEIGIKLQDEKVSVRMAVHGGGIVSIRKAAESTQFWTGAENQIMQVGEYTLTWAACEEACEAVMPWGSHERTRSLTIEGRGEFLKMFVAKSGGYRFVDVEAMPSHSSSGLLADAQGAPAALAARLMSGGEKDYKVGVSTLIESY
jgi:hypothetical protein